MASRTFVTASLAAALTISLFSDAAVATAPPAVNWQFAGWAGAGAFTALVPDPTVRGRVWLASDVSGLWRSDNRGGKWSFKTEGLGSLAVACLAVSAADANVVYAGTKAGVYRTEDAGSNWKFLTSTKGKGSYRRPENARSILADPRDAKVFYAGTKEGDVFVSRDAGATIAAIGGKPFGPNVAISALAVGEDGRFLFAASEAGVARASLQAGVWEKLGGPKGASDLAAAGSPQRLFVPSGNAVAYSADGGLTWSRTAVVPATSPKARVSRIDAIASPAGGFRLLVGWEDGWRGGVFLSEDSGRTWRDAEKNLTHDILLDPTRVWAHGFGRPLSVTFDRFSPETLYFSDFWGVWRSDDGGESWVERIRGAANSVGTDIAVADGGVVFASAMDAGLLKSSDAGVSFRSVAPVDAMDENVKGHVWKLLVSRAGTNVIATSSPWNRQGNQVLLSEDGGRTFRVFRSGLPETYPVSNTVWEKGYARALAADPSNPRRVYLGIDGDDGGGLYVSSDGGRSWTRSSGQPDSLRIYNGLAVDPDNPNRLYWGAAGTSANGGIYRSDDQGKTWHRVFSATGWVFDLAAVRGGTVYAATDATGPAFYVSNDAGATWKLSKKFGNVGACEGIAVDPNDPQRVAVSTVAWDGAAGGRIYFSGDGGTSWSDVTGDLPPGAGAAAMCFSPDGTYLYVNRYAGSVYRARL